ncbi:MAG TPA: hypothetical protein VIK99_01215 [Thermaerobacter sp.]
MEDELLDELRMLARAWRRVQADRREQRDSYRAMGMADRAEVVDAEAYIIGLFCGDLERLIQRFGGKEGGADADQPV